MPIYLLLISLSACVIISACSSDLPQNTFCENFAFSYDSSGKTLSSDEHFKQQIEMTANKVLSRTKDNTDNIELNFISLSAGGQYLAFGAGFMIWFRLPRAHLPIGRCHWAACCTD